MTIVKELNELAEKMTGTNPRATTDAQAMDFIEQHYQNGGGDTPSGGNEPLLFNVENALMAFYDNDEHDTTYTLSQEEARALGEIKSALTSNPKQVVYLYLGDYEYTLANYYANRSSQLMLSGMFVVYYQGTARVTYVFVADGMVNVCARDYTN